MIPISIKLRNFMAYRQAELDFQSFHLAALTGANGAGKSSLLDGMTWALWGKARSKTEEELIHLGAEEMEVSYSFGLLGNVHQVIRKRSRSGKGRGTLSFQVKLEAGWRTLTETSMKATQAKINEVIRLDYETFINSALLLQGRDAEFTTKTAGERKDILSDILGLGIYEVYEKRAKDKAAEAKTAVTVVEAKIKQVDEELNQEAYCRRELAAAETAVISSSQQRQAADDQVQVIYEQYRAVSDKQKHLEELRQRVSHEEKDRAYGRQVVAQLQATIAQYQARLARQEAVAQGVAELGQARATVEDWEQRLQQMSQLQQRQHALQRELDGQKAKLERELHALNTTIAMLSPKTAAITTWHHEFMEVETRLNQLKALEPTRQTQQEALGQAERELAALDQLQKTVHQEANDLKLKLAELHQAGAYCPVCKTPLSEGKRAEAIAQSEAEIQAKRQHYAANQRQQKTLMQQRDELKLALTATEKELTGLLSLQGQWSRLKHALEEAEQALPQLEAAQSQHGALQQQLTAWHTLPGEVRAELTQVEADLARVNYDRMAHQQAKKQADSLAHFEADQHALEEAARRLPEEEQRLAQEAARLARLEAQAESDQARLLVLAQETANLPQLGQALQQARQAADHVQHQERLARDKVAALKQQLNYLEKLREQRAELDKTWQKEQHDWAIYRELQAAFGKKGVQALLIETAIPEIEQEANALLTRMTDGRMHLRFETQREAKTTDNLIETLDIRISDELGARNYEMYSGGEAFRVNFAIRIAISKVLARRAGAQLQTLIIDEGFGSQDAAGRERLVEAINNIQHDFEKVIVITHVEELRDAFPVRIEVEKKGDGSQLVVRGV